MEVFVRGFSFTRGFSHPYVATRIGTAWRLRDAPRASGERRSDEWVVCGMSPEAIDELVWRHAEGRFEISAIVPAGGSDEDLRAGLRARDYRLITTESLMVHPLRRIPRFVAPVAVQRVKSIEMAASLARAARTRQILPEHLAAKGRAPLRAYVALADDGIVGWVRSIAVGDATWIASMYVVRAFRRRGIGKAMLGAVLRDDRAGGARESVLLASHAGAKLYPVAGFTTIGTLYLFTPRK